MSDGKMLKIGMLTYHRASNYGAFLQSCALCSRLNQEKDFDAEIIDFRMKKEADMYSLDRWGIIYKLRNYNNYKFLGKVYDAFSRADFSYAGMKLSKDSLVSDSIEEFQDFVRNKYDVIVAGSDEIWKADSFRGFPSPYWLIGDIGCRKFSCAVSARYDFNKLPDEKLEILKKAVSDFEFISVRDESTFNAVREQTDKPVYMCCDPSFVYDFDVKSDSMENILKGKAVLEKGKKNIVVMTEQPKIADKIRKKLSGKYNLISVFHWHKGYINVADLTPDEWLKVIKNADMVLASYFHAVCFSIRMHTKFIAFGSPGKAAKVKDLLEGSKLSGCYIDNAIECIDNVDIIDKINEDVNYDLYSDFEENQRKKFDVLIEKLRS